MNIVAISGRLTANPELKTTPNGVSVCAFDIAVPRPGTADKTDFLKCVAWRGTAEFVAKYFTKGQRIEITGCLTSRGWEDKDGNKRTEREILCERVGFGESKKTDRESSPAPVEPSASREEFEEITYDDCPF